MRWPWSKRQHETPAQHPAQHRQKPDAAAVHDAIMRGIDTIERKCADRVLLALYESEGTPASGRWIEGGETAYYPLELLQSDEQQMVKAKKTYTAIALVSAKPMGFVHYGAPGVELYERTRIHPMLPKLKEESNLHYVSKGGAYTGEQLEQLCGTMAASGWTPEAIDKSVEAGITAYREQTRELMRAAGVEESIMRMDAQERSGIDDLLLQIRVRRQANAIVHAAYDMNCSPQSMLNLRMRMSHSEEMARKHYGTSPDR